LELNNLEQKFTDIYNQNIWKKDESKSGTGSDLSNVFKFIPELVNLINSLNINTMIDAPCGDFLWMNIIIPNLKIKNYIGVDIVKDMIVSNQKQYGATDKVHFIQADIVNEILPKTDLIFCRDCLVHLSYDNIKQVLLNFVASESKYLLMTNFTLGIRNKNDIVDGNWRALNFTVPPFNLPEPISVISEHCTEDGNKWCDKSLGLWELNSLNEYAR
jgi:SAM-dependent methyltransferase